MKDWRDNFWAKVSRGQGDECWVWTGASFAQKDRDRAYGAFGRRVVTSQSFSDTRETAAHRVSWVIHYGPVPGQLLVLHKCDNPPCIRPDHLFLGTTKGNALDRHSKGRYQYRFIPRDSRERGYFQHE